METVMTAIKAVRSRRAEMNVPPSKKAHIIVVTEKTDIFTAGVPFLMKLAYASSVDVTNAVPENVDGMVNIVTDECKLYLPMAELVDLEQERERITRELEKAKKQKEAQEKKLSNESFVSKAPEQVVAAERDRLEKAVALIANLEESLKKLG
jgi:valyl-tRNA synthetase